MSEQPAAGTDRDRLSDIPLGPHRVPRIECSNCGADHHIDAASAPEMQPQCRECYSYIRRPTPKEGEKFGWFMVWNGRHMDRGTEYEIATDDGQPSIGGDRDDTWDISAGGPRDLNQQLSEHYGVEGVKHSPDWYDDEQHEVRCEVLTYWDGETEHFIADGVPVYGHGPSGAVGVYEDDLPSQDRVQTVVDQAGGRP